MLLTYWFTLKLWRALDRERLQLGNLLFGLFLIFTEIIQTADLFIIDLAGKLHTLYPESIFRFWYKYNRMGLTTTIYGFFYVCKWSFFSSTIGVQSFFSY